MKSKQGTLIAPERPVSVPENAQWLSGQGAGVWFYISITDKENMYNIKRFSPDGNLDCDRLFELEGANNSFDISKPYQFVHISHCAKCRIQQGEQVFVFNWVGG